MHVCNEVPSQIWLVCENSRLTSGGFQPPLGGLLKAARSVLSDRGAVFLHSFVVRIPKVFAFFSFFP